MKKIIIWLFLIALTSGTSLFSGDSEVAIKELEKRMKDNTFGDLDLDTFKKYIDDDKVLKECDHNSGKLGNSDFFKNLTDKQASYFVSKTGEEPKEEYFFRRILQERYLGTYEYEAKKFSEIELEHFKKFISSESVQKYFPRLFDIDQKIFIEMLTEEQRKILISEIKDIQFFISILNASPILRREILKLEPPLIAFLNKENLYKKNISYSSSSKKKMEYFKKIL